MSHADLIERLGGVSAVASALGTDTDRVYQWKRAGVAWRWRQEFAEIARAHGVALPVGFDDPRAKTPKPRKRAKGRAPR